MKTEDQELKDLYNQVQSAQADLNALDKLSTEKITPAKVDAGMRHHDLKTWPEYFKEVIAGRKTFEVRKADRDYQVGDYLTLEEYNPENDFFTGRVCIKRITYILTGGSFGIEPGYVVMGLATNILKDNAPEPPKPLKS